LIVIDENIKFERIKLLSMTKIYEIKRKLRNEIILRKMLRETYINGIYLNVLHVCNKI